MEKRIWIRSGIIEELDAKQVRLMVLVLEKIQFYYRHLHGTRPCFKHPLSLSRLARLCNRSGSATISAVRMLANSVPYESGAEPRITYDRVSSGKNASHRPYRIFLKDRK
jgi:hypothetical protein